MDSTLGRRLDSNCVLDGARNLAWKLCDNSELAAQLKILAIDTGDQKAAQVLREAQSLIGKAIAS